MFPAQIMNTDRQTGRTTQQIKSAPIGAIYVWPFAASLIYARLLASSLGRDDLNIIPESAFRYYRMASMRGLVAVIDHATELHSDGWDTLRHIRGQSHWRPEAIPDQHVTELPSTLAFR